MPIGVDPIASYCFFVEIDGFTIAQFKEVEGLSISVGVIEHKANTLGGQPIVKKLPGAVKFDDIVLRRGKVNDQSFWTWIRTVQQGDIDTARKNGSVLLHDYQRATMTRFNFEAGWPSRVEVGKLQAGADTVLLETVTITHEKLTVE